MGNKGIYIARFENGIHRVAIVEGLILMTLMTVKVKENVLHGKAFDDETTAQLYTLRFEEKSTITNTVSLK